MKTAVVIDNGSDSIKAGLAGEKAPRVVFPSVVGFTRHFTSSSLNLGQTEYFVGDEAIKKRSVLDLHFPINSGIIGSDSGDVEKLWSHTYSKELALAPEEHPVLMTDHPGKTALNREKIAQILFEKFRVPALYLSTPAELAMRASGRSTGIVLDAGHVGTFAVPVIEGKAVTNALQRVDVSGKQLYSYWVELSAETSAFTQLDVIIRKDIMKKLFYVAPDFEQEMKAAASPSFNKDYELETGEVISVGSEMFRCPEAFFQPSLIRCADPGLPQVLQTCIQRCPAEVQKELYANVVLAGGSSLFRGMQDRLQKDLAALAPPGTEVKVLAPAERACSAWMGGSLMAAEPAFQEKWITRQQFEETGAAIVSQKC